VMMYVSNILRLCPLGGAQGREPGRSTTLAYENLPLRLYT